MQGLPHLRSGLAQCSIETYGWGSSFSVNYLLEIVVYHTPFLQTIYFKNALRPPKVLIICTIWFMPNLLLLLIYLISSLSCMQPNRLLLRCSSSVHLSVHLSEMQSGMDDKVKTTRPIYFRVFLNVRSFWVDNAHLFHFLNSICHVYWNRWKPGCGLLYLITLPSACH